MRARTRLWHRTAFALVLGLAVAALPGRGADPVKPPDPFPHPKGYVCYRAPSPITIGHRSIGKAIAPCCS